MASSSGPHPREGLHHDLTQTLAWPGAGHRGTQFPWLSGLSPLAGQEAQASSGLLPRCRGLCLCAAPGPRRGGRRRTRQAGALLHMVPPPLTLRAQEERAVGVD